jgi:molecular chaperone DnaK (HSP70)
MKTLLLQVPVYFTDVERRALMDAVAGAGLNSLRLINDCTAGRYHAL